MSRDPNDETVVRLFTEWIERAQLPPEQAEVRMKFAEAEIDHRLISYEKKGFWWRVAQVAIWLLIAALGLLGAALAAAKTADTVAVVAGGLVAALSAFTSAAHPGRQADEYETARLAIRDQTWNLLNKTGGYKDLETDDERYEEFVNKIRDIVHRKRAATHIQM
jgi:hypothetical protein